MNHIFSKMSQKEAENIASNWHYEDIYSFYDIAADEEDLAEFLNPQERRDKYFSVKISNEDIGFFCFETKMDCVDIGLGMKPELTGRGLGMDFLKAGLSFAISEYNPENITLSVATFNERAIKLYEKVGFESTGSFIQDTNGSRYKFLRMKYKCVK